MELSDYIRVLRRNWIIVVASILAGMFIAAVFSLLTQPSYTAKTQLFVAIQSSGTVTELQQGNTFTQARIQSYVSTATTPAVLQPVIDSLALDMSPGELAGHIVASADLDTVLINVSASHESPVQAAALAQAVGASLIDVVEKLEQPSPGESSAVRLSVITPAVAPASPSSPNTQLNVAFGFIIGLGVGLGTAVLRGTLDTKVRGEGDLRKFPQTAILGGISYDDDATRKPLLTQTGQQSPRAESFRQIRTNMQFANINSKSKTMLITSSLPGEGKSTIATNMAIAMAQAGQRVVLVDADLRRPMVANYLGLEGNAGLTTALVGAADVDDLLQAWGDDDLFVLSSGRVPPNPSELLGSSAMSDLIKRLEDQFDTVIIDAPPLIPVTDAAVLAQKVGGVVIAVGAGKIRTQDLDKSFASLNLVHAHVLGFVLNLLPIKGPDAYASRYYTYESKPESRGKTLETTPALLSGSHMRVSRRRSRWVAAEERS